MIGFCPNISSVGMYPVTKLCSLVGPQCVREKPRAIPDSPIASSHGCLHPIIQIHSCRLFLPIIQIRSSFNSLQSSKSVAVGFSPLTLISFACFFSTRYWHSAFDTLRNYAPSSFLICRRWLISFQPKRWKLPSVYKELAFKEPTYGKNVMTCRLPLRRIVPLGWTSPCLHACCWQLSALPPGSTCRELCGLLQLPSHLLPALYSMPLFLGLALNL